MRSALVREDVGARLVLSSGPTPGTDRAHAVAASVRGARHDLACLTLEADALLAGADVAVRRSRYGNSSPRPRAGRRLRFAICRCVRPATRALLAELGATKAM